MTHDTMQLIAIIGLSIAVVCQGVQIHFLKAGMCVGGECIDRLVKAMDVCTALSKNGVDVPDGIVDALLGEREGNSDEPDHMICRDVDELEYALSFVTKDCRLVHPVQVSYEHIDGEGFIRIEVVSGVSGRNER